MKKEFEFIIDPEILSDSQLFKNYLARAFNTSPESISDIEIQKRSLDARSKKVGFQVRGLVYIGEKKKIQDFTRIFPQVKDKPRVLVVGAGPAGLFSALRLIELGFKPVILERGKSVRDRRRDIAVLNRSGQVDPESNYCFGEGGAGTYSDGKLYTRSAKRGSIETILDLFVQFGADPDIKVNARPHIGTNRLPEIIERIRNQILESGGEVHFGEKLTALHHSFGQITGLTTNGDHLWDCKNLILATGHSARDIFYLLEREGIRLEPKPFALGVRIEHSQELIDQIQYHCTERGPFLPPAYYQLKEQVEDRGVFSFCMCPGGIIAPCATHQEEVVVNGWSPSKRNNPFSNSGLVVQVELEDFKTKVGPGHPFHSLEFQKSVEKLACIGGGGDQKAPGQRMVDFVQNKVSSNLPKCSYNPGVHASSLKEILPKFIFEKLQKALHIYGKKMPGYYTNEAILVGVESRTSSPVKIPRNPDNFQHPDILGLYPCGEGAGYAGGILSAAMDGFKIAEAVAKNFTNPST